MGQSWPSVPGTSVGDDIVQLTTRSGSLLSCFSGATAPTSGVENGMLWYHTGEHKFYGRTNGAWVLLNATFGSDMNCLDGTTYRQILNLRLDNEAADPTPAGGGGSNVGLLVLHTGDEKAKIVVSSTVLESVMSAGPLDYIRRRLPLGSWIDHSTPPTSGVKGILAGRLFDAVGEKLITGVRVPRGYLGVGNGILRLYTMLNANEVDGDDENWDLELVAKQPNNGETFLAATVTTTTATLTRSTAGGVDEGDIGIVDLPIDYDHADNPIIASDFLALRIGRTDVTDVAGSILVDADLLFPYGPRGLTER